MPGTQVTQIRRPSTSGNITTYNLTATCVVAGTLPDVGIFVMQVVQAGDPKNDAFTRVCEVVDFTELGTNREAAISSNVLYYRVAPLNLSYADIETANAAWKELSDRINTLVSTYDQYIDEFLTPDAGNTTTYPTADEGKKAALIAAYEASGAAVAAAEEARDDENVRCEQRRTDLVNLQARLTEAQADVLVLGPVANALTALMPTLEGLPPLWVAEIGTVRTVNSSSSASAGDKNAIEGQMVNMSAQASTLATIANAMETSVQIPVGVYYATLQNRVVTLTAEINALQLQVNQCALEMAALQAAVDQARVQQNEALAAVRAVCPDYVPS